GLRLSVEYRSDEDGTWLCTVEMSKAHPLDVRSDGISVYTAGTQQEHRFPIQLEHRYELE
ncbi:MAG: hypothetical protein KAU31_07945, partial [Spirochaetaceae bacterium]|nr:hypothetical protein [Spirochaetaceae bacterium]